MSDETSKLLPCPFCGSADIRVFGDRSNEAVMGGYNAICGNPGCQSSARHSGDRDKAIRAWNRRVECVAALEGGVVPCEDCDGKGCAGNVYPGSDFQPPEPEKCPSCDGSGKWRIEPQVAGGGEVEQRAREILDTSLRALGLHEDAYPFGCGAELVGYQLGSLNAVIAALTHQR